MNHPVYNNHHGSSGFNPAVVDRDGNLEMSGIAFGRTSVPAAGPKHNQRGNIRTAAPHGGNIDTTVGGLLSTTTEQFYDSQKGGVQWGGIAGGLIGAAMAYVMAGSANSLWVVAGIALAAVVGGWAGNKSVDTIGKYVSWGKNTPQQPTAGLSQEPQRNPAQAPQSTIDPRIAKQALEAAESKPAQTPPAPTAPLDVKYGTHVTPTPIPAPPAGAGKPAAAPAAR